MNPLPKVVPISELRLRQNELLKSLSNKPIVLTQHGRPVAVLLGPDAYNRFLEQVEDLQLALDAVEAREAKEPMIDFEDYLAERGERVPSPADE